MLLTKDSYKLFVKINSYGIYQHTCCIIRKTDSVKINTILFKIYKHINKQLIVYLFVNVFLVIGEFIDFGTDLTRSKCCFKAGKLVSTAYGLL